MAHENALGEVVLAFVVFVLTLTLVAKLGGSFAAALTLAVLAAVGMFAFLYSNREPCPSCNSRAGRRWLHRRVDGGPDRRFRDNEAVCTQCLASWPLPGKHRV